MYFDGALNLEGAGAGILFISPRGDQLKYVLQIHYKASNNNVEYKGLIHGLHPHLSRHQETPVLQRLQRRHQVGEQGMGHQKRNHGRILRQGPKARSPVLRTQNSLRPLRTKRWRRRTIQARIQTLPGPGRRIRPRHV